MLHKSKIHPTTYQPNVCRLNLKKDIHFFLKRWFFLYCIISSYSTKYYICGKICQSSFHILSKKNVLNILWKVVNQPFLRYIHLINILKNECPQKNTAACSAVHISWILNYLSSSCMKMCYYHSASHCEALRYYSKLTVKLQHESLISRNFQKWILMPISRIFKYVLIISLLSNYLSSSCSHHMKMCRQGKTINKLQVKIHKQDQKHTLNTSLEWKNF